MTIGNLPDSREWMMELNKWYFGIEIRKCPPTMFGVFKPWISIVCLKIKKYGNYGVIPAVEAEKKGFMKVFKAPFAITFTFSWKNKEWRL